MSHQPLFRKYVVVFVVLVSGALITSGLLQAFFAYQENQAALGAIQHEKAASAAGRIAEFIDEVERLVAGALSAPTTPDGVRPEQRRNDFLRLLRQVPSIMEVSYLDRDGSEQVRISRLDLNVIGSQTDRSHDDAFVSARHGATYYGPVYFQNASEPYMILGVPERGSGSGVIVAEVNLKFIWDVVSQIRVGQAGFAYVVDNTGQLVAHPDISLVLRRADLSSLPQVQVLDRATPAVGGEASIARDLQARAVLTAREPIRSLGWWVFVEQPLEEAFAPLAASLVRTAILLVVGLGLSVVASLVLARRMVTPIQALQAGAARVGAGGLDQRIEVHTGDELEALAGEFNRMAAQLSESYATLEMRVEERTRDLAATKEQLESANRHKSEFLAGMSHELRTPLNAIIGFSDALAERFFGDLTPKQERYVQHILSSGHHLLSLINDILDLSKVEAGHMELDVERFSVVDALESGLTMVRERANRHHITLALTADSAPSFVEADERKVKQIVFNLLGNAVKFTPDGGRIDVIVRGVEEWVEIAICDTGVGIAAVDQPRIFDAFRQVGESVTHSNEGTGLGLALSRRFAELHGGRLCVSSEPGTGSTFIFMLPVRQLPLTVPAVSADGNGAHDR